jgi:hypothetical protein
LAKLFTEIDRMRRRAKRDEARSLDRQQRELEAMLGPGSANDLLQAVHELRWREARKDPRLVAATASFPLMRW